MFSRKRSFKITIGWWWIDYSSKRTYKWKQKLVTYNQILKCGGKIRCHLFVYISKSKVSKLESNVVPSKITVGCFRTALLWGISHRKPRDLWAQPREAEHPSREGTRNASQETGPMMVPSSPLPGVEWGAIKHCNAEASVISYIDTNFMKFPSINW